MEDEKHFLIKCSLYDNLREILFKKLELMEIKHQSLPEDQLFTTLINPPPKAQNTIAKYIYECFKIREEKIDEKQK